MLWIKLKVKVTFESYDDLYSLVNDSKIIILNIGSGVFMGEGGREFSYSQNILIQGL